MLVGAMGLRQIEHLVTATEALQTALKELPSLRDLRIDDCIKASRDQAVFRAQLGADTVVVKLSFGADPANLVSAQAAELRHHAPRMSSGPYRTPGLVAAAPEQGLIVMEYIPGRRFDEAMLAASRTTRNALTVQAGRWLVRLIGDRRRPGTLPAGYWLGRTKQVAQRAPAGDRTLVRNLVDWMEGEAARVDQSPLTQVRGHGDFCPVNLIVGEDAIWGIDLQSNQWFALVRDLARYLVVSRLVNGAPDTLWNGVDGDEATALLAVPGLIETAEADRLMPYFLAGELARRLASDPGSETARCGLHASIEDFLATA